MSEENRWSDDPFHGGRVSAVGDSVHLQDVAVFGRHLQLLHGVTVPRDDYGLEGGTLLLVMTNAVISCVRKHISVTISHENSSLNFEKNMAPFMQYRRLLQF